MKPKRHTRESSGTVTNLGVIFDWDGVVVDSSALHVQSWDQLSREEGKTLPKGLKIGSLGVKTEYVITHLAGWTRDPAEVARIALRKEDIFREMVAAGGLDPQPGVVHFMQGLRALNIPCAVGSSAPRQNIEVGMDALGIRELVQAVATGDDVEHGKPAPDIFLKAAERLGHEPEHCVVFEDAPAGVEAARAAGMFVVGVLSAYSKERLGNADHLIKTFEELTTSDLLSWFEVRRA